MKALLVFSVLLSGLMSNAAPNQSQADASVTRGKALWSNRGCAACHAIGKKLAGPDMAGVSQRRTREWLGRFLKGTTQMLTTDSTAKAMLKEWKGVKMPQITLSDADVDAILAYVKSEEGKAKK